MRFEIWKNSDSTEWACLRPSLVVPVDTDGHPMSLIWTFEESEWPGRSEKETVEGAFRRYELIRAAYLKGQEKAEKAR